MSDTPTRRPARHATDRSTDRADDAVVALVRRAKLPALPDASPRQMLRAAGVPLVAAALVASTHGTAHAETGAAPATPAAGSPKPVKQSPTAAPKPRTPAKPAAPATPTWTTYTVKEGDNVATIAQRTGSTAAAIISANKLPASGLIHPGQKLVLPGVPAPAPKPTTKPVPKPTSKPAPKPSTKPAAKPASRATPARTPVVHVVKRGDTLSDLAKKYRISLAALASANKLTANGVIRVGQRLVLPGVTRVADQPQPTPPPTHPYTVKQGDTLIGISRQAKADLDAVLTLNDLSRSSVIHPGQTLQLPGPPPVPNTFLGRTYPDAVAQAAAANRAVLAKRDLPSRAQMQEIVVATARSMGLDPNLAQAIAYQESGFNPRVVSPANAIGTMQVIPSTGTWASQLVGRKLDLLDPKDNATAGVAVLAALLAQADDEGQAIAGYYQGLGSVRKNGLYDDTRRYVASVQRLKARFAAGQSPTAP